jgi:hypothetical protein
MGGCHLLDAYDVEAEIHQPVLCRGVDGQVAYDCLDWFLRLGQEGEVGQMVLVEVGLNRLEVHQALRENSGPVSCITELKGLCYHILQLLLQLDQVGGGCQYYCRRSTWFSGSGVLTCGALGKKSTSSGLEPTNFQLAA